MNTEQMKPARLALIAEGPEELHLLERAVQELAADGRTLQILEAGCGQQWVLDLGGTSYVLTGVDLDEAALNTRRTVQKDLHEAIHGDLRTVQLPEAAFDVVYNSFVLEHIPGAEQALENFLRWLKPGGRLILRVPDPQSVYGAMARLTPFWFHVWFKRHIVGNKDVGKPGVGPFPTVYDPVVSRSGVHRWCRERGLVIRAEYGWNYAVAKPGLMSLLTAIAVKTLHWCTFGRWADDHINLTYIIEKPQREANAPRGQLQSQGAGR